MRYLLDEDEMARLEKKTESLARDAAIDELRIALLQAKKFTCIHDKKVKHSHYCDDCPASGLVINKLACQLPKNYSH